MHFTVKMPLKNITISSIDSNEVQYHDLKTKHQREYSRLSLTLLIYFNKCKFLKFDKIHKLVLNYLYVNQRQRFMKFDINVMRNIPQKYISPQFSVDDILTRDCL